MTARAAPAVFAPGARIQLWSALDRLIPGVGADHLHDGDSSDTGDTGLLLAYNRHLVVPPHLAGAHLGSPEEEARDWLVDRKPQMLSLAEQEAARWPLLAQGPRYHHTPLEYTQTDLGRLLDSLKEAASPIDWPAKLAEALRERRANERLMLAWLDQHRAEPT